jgi:hypothetical protein
MKNIFYDGKIWKGFEAPEKPEVSKKHLHPLHWHEYEKAYAEAKRNALPVLNPEILKGISYLDLKSYGEDYDWPGAWEVVEQYWTGIGLFKNYRIPDYVTIKDDSLLKGLSNNRKVIVLSLPEPVKPESKTKTAEEILNRAYKDIPGNVREYCLKFSLDAMQEYSNQQLAAFKEVLRKDFDLLLNRLDSCKDDLVIKDVINTIKKLIYEHRKQA